MLMTVLISGLLNDGGAFRRQSTAQKHPRHFLNPEIFRERWYTMRYAVMVSAKGSNSAGHTEPTERDCFLQSDVGSACTQRGSGYINWSIPCQKKNSENSRAHLR